MNLLFSLYALAKTCYHSMPSNCHNNFEKFTVNLNIMKAGLESHLDQLAEVFTMEKETIIQFRVQPWLKSAILVGIE